MLSIEMDILSPDRVGDSCTRRGVPVPIERPSTPARYVEIAADLRRRIVDLREWAPGDQLPSQKELCEEYDVSAGVMLRGQKVLINQGLLRSKPGVGVFVRRRPERNHISTPRYVEIAADLRRRIVDKREWAPGEHIPSHRALCEEYDASDSTLHQVRKLLIAEGLVESHPGAGTFVRRRTVRHRITRIDAESGRPRMVPLREQERPAGRLGEWSCRSQTVVADRALAWVLRIEPGERVVETAYQFRSTGVLVRLTTCWEPYTIVGATPMMLPEDGPLAGRSVRERMAELNVKIREVEEEVVARPASAEEGDLLGGGTAAPVLEVTRLFLGGDGRPVHAERTVVRGDRGSLLYRV
jgi:DNA-binding GntR family transcriptional regulator